LETQTFAPLCITQPLPRPNGRLQYERRPRRGATCVCRYLSQTPSVNRQIRLYNTGRRRTDGTAEDLQPRTVNAEPCS